MRRARPRLGRGPGTACSREEPDGGARPARSSGYVEPAPRCGVEGGERSMRAFVYAADRPWAITEAGLRQILEIAERSNASPEAVAARLGRPLENTRTVEVRDGVAVIPVTGPIFRYANLFTE